jgi:hypothetical protein
MADKLNIELELVPDKRDWVIKKWNVYSNNFYLGSIIKREIGKGTPIRTKKSRTIAYQCSVKLFSSEDLGFPHKYRIDKLEDLKTAKNMFKEMYQDFINALSNGQA